MAAPSQIRASLTDPQFALLIVSGVIVFHLIIIIIPLGYSFWLSLHETNVILRSQDYVGFDKWGEALTEEDTIFATLRSLYFAGVSVVLSFVLSLGIALVLNQEFAGRSLLRAMILLPWAVSEVVTATMWTIILEPTWGVMTGIFPGTLWISSDWAMFWVSLAFVWHMAPLGAFFFLAALQTIPKDLYNCARIDRAGMFARFQYVTLPHIRYAVLIVLVVVTVEAFRQFDLIYAMTGGGPGTVTQILPLLIFRYNFQFSQYGLAAAASYILIIIATILAIAYFVALTQKKTQTRKAIESKKPIRANA